MINYDYIIAGAGAAGLSLVAHMIHSGKFSDKKILLVDRAPKTRNDRTWCFWEQEPGLFESIVYRKWNSMWFHGAEGGSRLYDVSPYQYKMIRGIDFYNYCFTLIGEQKNITVEYGTIEKIQSSEAGTFVLFNGLKINATYIFCSINPVDDYRKAGHYFLWQHFKGWFIQTEKEIFNPVEATLMDFRVDQENDSRFVYVMPFNKNEALVEYTVFSENSLSDEEYNDRLRNYCSQRLMLKSNEYIITNEEFGKIPMTNYDFPSSHYNIIYIGSAGGKTKASTGYTFRYIQMHSEQILHSLVNYGSPHIHQPDKKFSFYDSILLKILSEKKLSGARIFRKLFETNKMNEVFKFLDNETSLGEDLKLISSLPKSKFISAAFSHLLYNLFQKKIFRTI